MRRNLSGQESGQIRGQLSRWVREQMSGPVKQHVKKNHNKFQN